MEVVGDLQSGNEEAKPGDRDGRGNGVGGEAPLVEEPMRDTNWLLLYDRSRKDGEEGRQKTVEENHVGRGVGQAKLGSSGNNCGERSATERR